MFKIRIKERKCHPYVGRTFIYKMDTIPKPYTVKDIKEGRIYWQESGTYSSFHCFEEYLETGDVEEIFLNKIN